MPEVKIVNMTKRYGRIVANDKINLKVKDREYITMLGPSGCGKTTLIKGIAGIVRPDEGEIFIGGIKVNDVSMEDRGIGYVFQNIALFPHMDVWDNVTYAPKVKGWTVEETRPLALEMLEMIRLSVRSDAYPFELSGGMQQKTAVARALTSRAELLLFDEPLGALDARVRVELRNELRRLIRMLELTAIHVTHDQEEAMSISDRIVVMKSGRIVEVGTPYELYTRPKNLFTANFVGEANILRGEIRHTTQEGSTIDIRDGLIIKTTDKSHEKGEIIVLAFRPEFGFLKRDRIGINNIPGKIIETVFTGPLGRFRIRLRNGEDVVIKQHLSPKTTQQNGDNVFINIKPSNILVYPYPESGLESELALEKDI
jgi:ABC-type Fe3+/spermidine/putrescine transport system ATPase subunit